MKTYLQLKNTHRCEFPDEFQKDDVRFSESLVEHFVREFTREGDVVFDPFAGYGTTLMVAEEMGRVAYGIEFDERRVRYARARLEHPERLIHGDSRRLASYRLPPFDLSVTSPPYMGKNDRENPLTNYTTGGDYTAYLQGLSSIYEQLGQLLKPGARAVVEVANLRLSDGLTTLAWDVAGALARVLHFEGEVVVGWDEYGFGYDHSYCLVFCEAGKEMDLRLAVALSSAGAVCRVRFLASGDCLDARRSEPMVEGGILVEPGQLVAVDAGVEPPLVVYRWPGYTMGAARNRPVRQQPGPLPAILEVDRVLDADGNPADLEQLRADFFPRIRSMYREMAAAERVDPRRVVEEGYDRIDEGSLDRLEDEDHARVRARYTSVLLDELPAGAEVLDLGCGSGLPTARALARRFAVTGVDISGRRIALARRNVPRARFIHADVTRLDLPPASFDGIVAFYSIFHVPREEQPDLLRNVASWLRPDGFLVAAMGARPIKADVADLVGVPMYWSSFDAETNRRLVEDAGLRIVSASEETFEEDGEPVTFLWLVAQKTA
jgi:SAM-dependent methyltransferase